MDSPKVSLIIPAYNEQERIVKTLDRVREYLSKQSYTYDVIVVLDGPTDNTPAVVAEYAKKFKELRVIHNKQNRGKGYAVRSGMLDARGEYRVFTDADNSTDVSYLNALLKKFDEGYDVVISSRDKKDAPGASQAVKQQWVKRQKGNAGNIFIQLVAVPGIWDTQNGFKGFTARSAEDIFSRAAIDRWGFDIEALALARHLGYKIGIIGIVWKNDPKSHVKLSGYFQVLWETVKVRLNLMSGAYRRNEAHA
jgi:dolichyl-phosphate beta-glucosyltransferase